jgi:signal transduction histidine kinase
MKRSFSLAGFLSAIFLVFTIQASAQLLEGMTNTHVVTDSLRIKLATTPPNSQERVKSLNELAKAYRYNSTDSSLLYATEAFQLASRLGDRRGKAWSAYHQSYALYGQGKYDLAMEKLVATLPEFESIPDTNGIASVLNEVGNIFKRQNRFNEAIEYYRRSLQAFRSIRNNEGSALELSNIGATNRMAGDFRASFENSIEALGIAERANYEYGVVFAATNIGACYAHWQQYDSALAFYYRALTIAERINNEKYVGQLYYLIGAVYGRQKRFGEAEEYITKGLNIAQTGRFAERVKEAYLTYVELYTAKGDFEKALTYHQRYSTLQDSLFSADVRKNIDDLQTRIATEKKDKEIRLLQKEQELTSLVRNFLIAAMVLLAMLFWLLVNRYQIKRNSEAQMRVTNDKLLQANAQLGEANAHLGDANVEITRQMGMLEEQAREIEITNSELQELTILQEVKNTQLKELNEEKNEFLGIAAHDLKNPLSGIQSIAEVLMMDESLAVETRRELLMHVVKSSERMFELIKNLLDVNAIERGGFQPELKATNIQQIATLAHEHYVSRAAQKNITITFTSETTESVRADHAALEQVLDNLVSNAVKYSPHDKQIHTRLRLAEGGMRVRFEVQDEGPGISEQDKSKLFGKFARLSAQPTGGEHSTGLGLSIVKKMVEAMNGDVWCESELGKGATFILELPKSA